MLDQVEKLLRKTIPFVGEKRGELLLRPPHSRSRDSRPAESQRLSVGKIMCCGDFAVGIIHYAAEMGIRMAESDYLMLVHMPSGFVQQILAHDRWEPRRGTANELSLDELKVDGDVVTLSIRFSDFDHEEKCEQLQFFFRPSFIKTEVVAQPWQVRDMDFVL